MKTCHHCRKELDIGLKVGRRDTCPYCDADLHICLNCIFYDTVSYNQCRETQAERVVDKEKSNFCDYFNFRDSVHGESRKENKDSAQDKLEALFKK
jgi:hypothetical protein